MTRGLPGKISAVISDVDGTLVTAPAANTGTAFSELALMLAVPPDEIAVIGDGANDVAMFERSALSIAMGNGTAAVRGAADDVTDANSADGVANAIERFILGRRGPVGAASLAGGSC